MPFLLMNLPYSLRNHQNFVTVIDFRLASGNGIPVVFHVSTLTSNLERLSGTVNASRKLLYDSPLCRGHDDCCGGGITCSSDGLCETQARITATSTSQNKQRSTTILGSGVLIAFCSRKVKFARQQLSGTFDRTVSQQRRDRLGSKSERGLIASKARPAETHSGFVGNSFVSET